MTILLAASGRRTSTEVIDTHTVKTSKSLIAKAKASALHALEAGELP
jgi:hypothetical protein